MCSVNLKFANIYIYRQREKKKRTDLRRCNRLYDETQGNKETQPLSTENCLHQVQEEEEEEEEEEEN